MEHQLRDELLRRQERDQQIRKNWLDEQQDEDGTTVRRVDADNTAWLAEVIAEYGWPGETLVGVDGAHATWLLAQHAGPGYQERWLGLLREAVERGDAQVRDLAYLEDRVHLRQQQPQRYGTQWIATSGGDLRLFPLADWSRVNMWRATVDLEPLDEHDLDQAWQSDDLWQGLEEERERGAR